jgi:diguanylate cyclase (GGDEF)-like protein
LTATGVRKLTLPIAAMIAVIAALLIGIAVYAGVGMNRTALEGQRTLVSNTLHARMLQSLAELRSVAWWDDAVVNTGGASPNKEWMEVELGAYIVESYRHDRVMVLDASDRPIFAYGPQGYEKPEVYQRYLSDLRPLIHEVRGLAPPPAGSPDRQFRPDTAGEDRMLDWQFGKWASRFRMVSGRPAIANVMTITPSYDTGLVPQRPTLLISIIFIDSAFVKTIGKATVITDLRIAEPGQESSGSMLVGEPGALPITSLHWTAKQPGRLLLTVVVPMIALGLLVAGATAALLLRRLIRATDTLATQEAEAQHLANHDSMTGLPNRRRLTGELAARIEAAQRIGQQVAVACIDIDRFKEVNDTLGHHAGDELICGVAERLSGILHDGDFLARLGGDELAILRTCPTENRALSLGSLVASAFELPFAAGGHQIDATASVGLALSPKAGPVPDLIRQADIALYEAKAKGRDCTVVYAPSMGDAVEQRRATEIDLRRALGADELFLVYQPVIDAKNGAMTGVEALVRWRHPERGLIAPDKFIGVAEDAGLMGELGRFVIERAVLDSLAWPGLSTAINVSPAQFRSATLLADLRASLDRHGVPAKGFVLEVTESVLMNADGRTKELMKSLRAEGFRLALDDFGTGFSSLGYLREFPFDKLKIDRSFVRGVTRSKAATAIVQSVVDLGLALDIDVVAEGVETEEELAAMQRAGCTHIQGHLFSRAVEAERIVTLAGSFAPVTLSVRERVRAA